MDLKEYEKKSGVMRSISGAKVIWEKKILSFISFF